MKLLDTTHKLFTPDKARDVAKQMGQNDDDWEFRVIDCPKGTGYSFIEIYDELGEFVGRV